MLRFVLADGQPPPRGPGRPIRTWQDDGRVFADAVETREGIRIHWDHIGVLLADPASPVVRVWPPADATADTALVRAATIVQPLLLQARGYQCLHASAARTRYGIAAFCGLSGAGKSTIAYVVGRQPGSRQVADDALVIDARTERILACPIPFRSRLRAPAQAFFAGAETANDAPIDRPASIDSPAPLAAIFLIDAHEAAPAVALTRVGQTQAFSAVLTHAHCFDEHDRTHVAALTRAYLDLAARVPVYRLSYPRRFEDLDRVAARVDRAVAGGGADARA